MDVLQGILQDPKRVLNIDEGLFAKFGSHMEKHLAKSVLRWAWLKLQDSQDLAPMPLNPNFSMDHPGASPWIFKYPVTYIRGNRPAALNAHERVNSIVGGSLDAILNVGFEVCNLLLCTCPFVSPVEETFQRRWITCRYGVSGANKTLNSYEKYVEYFFPGYLSLQDDDFKNLAENAKKLIPIELYVEADLKTASRRLAHVLNAAIIEDNEDKVVIRGNLRSDVICTSVKPYIAYGRNGFRILPRLYAKIRSGLWETMMIVPNTFDRHILPAHSILDVNRAEYRCFPRLPKTMDMSIVYRHTPDELIENGELLGNLIRAHLPADAKDPKDPKDTKKTEDTKKLDEG